jgi:tRNA (guanosine-2'-O-)-methyltransferase
MRTERRLHRLEQVLRYRQPDLTVVVENVHDPHNVSAVLRSCDAAGIMEVQLIYTNADFPDIGKKSSASAGKWVERRRFQSVKECYDKLHEEGFSVFATRLEKKALSPYEVDLTQKVAIVVGNEHEGVSREATQRADEILQIPMHGMIESLNVSVATAVILFEAVRQRMSAKSYVKSKLSDAEVSRLLKIWAMKE